MGNKTTILEWHDYPEMPTDVVWDGALSKQTYLVELPENQYSEVIIVSCRLYNSDFVPFFVIQDSDIIVSRYLSWAVFNK